MLFDISVLMPITLTLTIEAATEDEAASKAAAKMERAKAFFEANHQRMLDEANMMDQAGAGGVANA